jgi:hypothetical protein
VTPAPQAFPQEHWLSLKTMRWLASLQYPLERIQKLSPSQSPKQ